MRVVWVLSCVPLQGNETKPSTEERLLELESKLDRTGTIVEDKEKRNSRQMLGRKASQYAETLYINIYNLLNL